MIYDYMLDKKLESLHEDTICKEDGYYISIDFSHTETNFKYDPYVKVYNAENYRKATKVARIYFFKRVEYVPEHIGPEVTTYNNKELRTICRLLTDNWSRILYFYIKGCNISDENKIKEIQNTPCPNFYSALCK